MPTTQEYLDALDNQRDILADTLTEKGINSSQDEKFNTLVAKVAITPSASTSNYTDLINKPRINSVELVGDKTLEDIGINISKSGIQDDNSIPTSSQVKEYVDNVTTGLMTSEKLDAEISTRELADTDLQNQVDSIKKGTTTVGQTIADKNGDDIVLTYATKEYIDNFVSGIMQSISSEATTRKNADDNIDTQINNYSTRVITLEGLSHNHSNITTLNDISSDKVIAWDTSVKDITTMKTTDSNLQKEIADIKSGETIVNKAINDENGNSITATYATKSETSSVYKICGNVSSIPSLESQVVGNVYNITTNFTTTSDFVDGASKTYGKGTNIVCVSISGTKKWDVLSGMVDLSPYAHTDDLTDGSIVVNKASNDENGNNIVITYSTKEYVNSSLATIAESVSAEVTARKDADDKLDTKIDLYTARLTDVENIKHSHVNLETLNDVTPEKVSSWDDCIVSISSISTVNANLQNEISYIKNGTTIVASATADKNGDNIDTTYATKSELSDEISSREDANNALDNKVTEYAARVETIESANHVHSNLDTLNTITSDKVSSWDSCIERVEGIEVADNSLQTQINNIKSGVIVAGKSISDKNGNDITTTYTTKAYVDGSLDSLQGNISDEASLREAGDSKINTQLSLNATRISSLESAKHTHSNISVLDSISSTKVISWDTAVSDISDMKTIDSNLQGQFDAIENGITLVSRALNDKNGNSIVDTYSTKAELSSEASKRTNGDTALDTKISDCSTRISSLEDDTHTHSNLILLDNLDDEQVSAWNESLSELTDMKETDSDLYNKITNITNGTTVVAKATSDKDGNDITTTYATKSEISSVYKVCGNTASIPSISSQAVGNVYNVTTEFTTTTDFIEGSGKSYPDGTNIVCVSISGTKKWDVFSGLVDLSLYATKAELASSGMAVDTELSSTSTNPVQNKAIKAAIDATIGRRYYDGDVEKGTVFDNYEDNIASGDYSIAAGNSTTASSIYSLSFGNMTNSFGKHSISFGEYTESYGDHAIAGGSGSMAEGNYSISLGLATTSYCDYALTIGKYNVDDLDSKFAFVIGNGGPYGETSNAFAVDWNGLLYINNSETGVDISNLATTEEVTNIINGTTVVAKATGDKNGKDITTTYATKAEMTTESTARTESDVSMTTRISDCESRLTPVENSRHNHPNLATLNSISTEKVTAWDDAITDIATMKATDTDLQTQITNITDGTTLTAKSISDKDGNDITTTYATNTSVNDTATKLSQFVATEMGSRINADTLLHDMITENTTRITTLEGAKHSHSNLTVLNGITSTKVTSWDGTITDITAMKKTDTDLQTQITNITDGTTLTAKATGDKNGKDITTTYATKAEMTTESTARSDADTALDTKISGHATRITTLEGAKHAHSNLTVLNGITSAKVTSWDGTITDITAMKNTDSSLQSQITNIINGTTIVPKATSDKNGNDITTTYATKSEIASVYKVCGNTESIPTLSSQAVGNVYNVTSKFTTTTDFVEGSGKSYTDGTNIVCVSISGTKKWDVFSGLVDLSLYATKSELTAESTARSDADTALDTKISGHASRITTLEGAKHSHSNLTVLNGITSTKVTSWDGTITDITAMKKTDTSLQTQITNITNGTTIVPKTTSDKNGNDITTTYATKAELASSGMEVDDALSDTSTNPVQNKVVKAAIDATVGRNYYVNGVLKGVIFGNYTSNTALGDYAFANGQAATASGNYSFANGWKCTASKYCAFANGQMAIASGNYAFANGYYVIAASAYSTVFGKYNVLDTADKYAFALGNGTAKDSRSNALAIDWDGLIYINNSTTGVDISKMATTEEVTNITNGTTVVAKATGDKNGKDITTTYATKTEMTTESTARTNADVALGTRIDGCTTRLTTLEGVKHTHSNLTVLNGITSTKVTSWDTCVTDIASMKTTDSNLQSQITDMKNTITLLNNSIADIYKKLGGLSFSYTDDHVVVSVIS